MIKSILILVVALLCIRPVSAGFDLLPANNIGFEHNDGLIVEKKPCFDTKKSTHCLKHYGVDFSTQHDKIFYRLLSDCDTSSSETIIVSDSFFNFQLRKQTQSFDCKLSKTPANNSESNVQYSFPADTTSPLLKKWQVNTFATCYYGGSLTGLYFLWYSDYSSGAFHIFDDSREWKGMDKLGHTITTFQVARIQSELYRAAGYETGQSARIGAFCSFGYLTLIEVMDGFSDGWGFSMSDWAADGLGLSLFALNELAGRDNLLTLKFSSSPSNYAQYNPELLGKNWVQSTLKDYNGQTYWLSLNIAECLKESNRFPAWLNMAVGYGANGMIGAEDNPAEVNGVAIPYFERYNQIFLSPDIDFSKIKVNGRGWKLLLSSLNFIKFPAPALEWNNNNGMKFHFLYF